MTPEEEAAAIAGGPADLSQVEPTLPADPRSTSLRTLRSTRSFRSDQTDDRRAGPRRGARRLFTVPESDTRKGDARSRYAAYLWAGRTRRPDNMFLVAAPMRAGEGVTSGMNGEVRAAMSAVPTEFTFDGDDTPRNAAATGCRSRR